MGVRDRAHERAIPLFLVALSLLAYGRLYMLRDAYADDNNWLLAMYISDNLHDFLATGFIELRRVPQGLFVYAHLLPYRLLENPYIVWHTLILAVQVASPLVLYKLVRNLSDDAWLAAFVAAVFTVAPLEHVAPYICTLNYRLGTLLAVTSLYLTDDAAREGRWGWKIPLALVLGGVAEHVLIEAAIGFEPARLLLLWNRFHHAQRPFRETLARLVKWLTPFALLGIALVAYKLILKPYGVYTGIYSTSLSYFFDRDAVRESTRLFTFGLWRILKDLGAYAHSASIVLGVLAGGAALSFLLLAFRAERLPPGEQGHGVIRSRYLVPVGIGITTLVPGLFIFFYAGRPPKLGTDSIHAILMQPGHALVLGAIAHWMALRAKSLGRRYFLPAALGLALVTGMGVYFSNLNLDLFKQATTRQEEFWRAFKKRFPAPPEHADFVIDAATARYSPRLESFFSFEDLYAYYELELSINRLYAPERLSGRRRYRVYSVEEMKTDYRNKGPAMFANPLVRATHFGTDTLDFAQMTYVYWRGGQLLVNEEILKPNPAAIYRNAANKPLPTWAVPPASQ